MCLELVNSFSNEIVALCIRQRREKLEYEWLRVESRSILFSHIYDVCCAAAAAVFGGVRLTFRPHINCLFSLRVVCLMLYMRFSSLIFTLFFVWCRKKMEIIECGCLDFHRMDSPLFTVLGDGSCSLLSPLLSRCHFQFDANRWAWEKYCWMVD